MADTVVKVMNNGPIVISGSFEVQDASGRVFTVEAGKPAALCRCGASSTKPFCDGTHRSGGFESRVEAG
jgi:CDGSH-type Zn-finger protein